MLAEIMRRMFLHCMQVTMTGKATWAFIFWAGTTLAFVPSCKDEANEPLLYSTINEAAEKGSLADVKRHLAKGEAVNAVDQAGKRPLHYAAERDHMDVVEYLIAKGAEVDVPGGREGHTPLMNAADNHHMKVVDYLIAKGADLNAKGADYHFTELQLAAYKGDIHVVEYFIAKGADVNAGDSGAKPLDLAVTANHKDVADLLRKHGSKETQSAATEGMPLANASQLTAATAVYCDQHKDQYPPPDKWPQVLSLGSPALYAEPGKPGTRMFAMNAMLKGLNQSDVPNPTQTVLFFECAPGRPPAGAQADLPATPRFPQGYIIGFCDNHAAMVPVANLPELIWNPKAHPAAAVNK